MFEGRSLGMLQSILSIVGIYASWQHVTSRMAFVAVYAIGCFVWSVLECVYLVLLLVSRSSKLRNAAVSLFVSNTFPNLAPALDSFFKLLREDVGFFALFSAVTGVFFDVLATYWAVSLYRDAVEVCATSDLRAPLLPPRSSPSRHGISGFGSLSRPAQATQTSPRPGMNPFGGRGFRLGSDG